MTARFADEFERIMKESGQTRLTGPNQVLDAWEAFVAASEDGYGWTIYEYDNDIAVRDAIEHAISSSGLRDFPELAVFQQRLASIDRRFETLLAAGPDVGRQDRAWWYRRLPPTGGSDFVEDALGTYGVTIAEV